MPYQLLAFDYDGTLAEHGQVPAALQEMLARLHQRDYKLFLVTGRHLNGVDLGAMASLFTGIVWENGAVLAHTATGTLGLPFGAVAPALVHRLEQAGVPLGYGHAIVASWAPHDTTVRAVLSAWDGQEQAVYNKGAVMILPPGADKGPGLAELLRLCGYQANQLAAFGDGENDLTLLRLAGFGIAVGDAVPGLQAAADMVASEPGPHGVLSILQRHWIEQQPLPVSQQRQ